MNTPCAVMQDLMDQVRLLAPLDTPLLLAGETGTGKTWLARIIHTLSPRRDEPFQVVHCGAQVADLLESEVFGYVKGAFPGADQDHTGKLAEANRGTLLLNDIGYLPWTLQGKLLRALAERVFQPLGSSQTLPARARLIAASNRSLDPAIQSGRFRPDLYYRLSALTVHLPPLRERTGVIPHLAAHFVAEFAVRGGRPVRGIAAPALRALQSYRWPGNIRELRNVLERAVALCPGPEIQPEDLPEVICSASTGYAPSNYDAPAALVQARDEAERARILATLQEHDYNHTRAARALGINRRTLYKKLKRYGVSARPQANSPPR
jgi:DNA-binding NtrC family response regulator